MTPPSAADRRLLPEGRFAGPMPWVIAIMMFLTVLAAAAGLAMASAAGRLDASLTGRVTVQVVTADADAREAQARLVEALLRRQPGVERVSRVAPAEMRALLRPWLGDATLDDELPIPAMIDAELDPAARGRLGAIADAVRAAAPAARLDDHARWIGPLVALVRSLGWLAAGIVALMAAATGAAVALAARAALDTHRQTIEVLHMMGATDVQVARLFQRRLALDALFGAALGFTGALVVLIAIGRRVNAIGSGLVGSLGLGGGDWVLLVLLPLAAGLLALLIARYAVLRALRRAL